MTIVIYHSADTDGVFCREIAKKYLGEKDVEYIGWNFGDKPIATIVDRIYVMDLSPDCLCGDPIDVDFERVVWIDHHKTSIEKYQGYDILGYRIDGVAACRLAWQWFVHQCEGTTHCHPSLPTKQDFIDRKVIEPIAVLLAGEYDVWCKDDPRAETFQYALRVVQDEVLPSLIGPNGDYWVEKILPQGQIAQTYAQKMDASICNDLTWLMEWEGLKWLCVNHARFNSNLFLAKDVPETGHDALLGFRFNGKQWLVSLYHARHRTDLDLSEIAKKHGGGGHAGACGFVCKQLPFSL